MHAGLLDRCGNNEEKKIYNLDSSSYWSLRGSDVFSHPSAWQGEDIFKRLTNGLKNELLILILR